VRTSLFSHIALIAAASCTAWAGLACAREPVRWTASWATAVMRADAGSALSPVSAEGVTIRQFVRISTGGKRLRLRLSNAFGTEPLKLSSVRVALATRTEPGAVRQGTSRPARFNGVDTIVIPAGAEYASDPIDIPVNGLATVAVSFYLPKAPQSQTIHYISKATSYLARGNVSDFPVLRNAVQVEHWYQLAAIDVDAGPDAGTIAVLGDSITDGHGASLNGNDRWTDILAQRLQADAKTRNVGVANFGVSGNRLLKEGGAPAGIVRFNREVLSQPGIRTLVVFEGVNDIGMISREGPVTPEARDAVVTGLKSAYAQIISYAHARGIRVVGATLLPFGGTKVYRSDVTADADRQRVNSWIRAPGHFDAVIDFDEIMGDPAARERLKPAYDTGDGLHPSAAGYRAMGEFVRIADLLG
jgi:lysophospholipase L1-like esterase